MAFVRVLNPTVAVQTAEICKDYYSRQRVLCETHANSTRQS